MCSKWSVMLFLRFSPQNYNASKGARSPKKTGCFLPPNTRDGSNADPGGECNLNHTEVGEMGGRGGIRPSSLAKGGSCRGHSQVQGPCSTSHSVSSPKGNRSQTIGVLNTLGPGVEGQEAWADPPRGGTFSGGALTVLHSYCKLICIYNNSFRQLDVKGLHRVTG
ncbi:Epithelial splicing regulatory protein 2 [Platysternon megacephalum]|uniref:Epithelial splicing regulatory protein 2 n=1 Tax=Platysternon megacephalum TaxID=55544 RepID=A0A4D9ENH9_9SAUR|nr:Epithelial splicing regulatory protein 2 [Platysternon megacephalum]